MNSTRWEAAAKVRGEALYTAEEPVPGTLHAAIVGAPMPSGRVTHVDSTAARVMPGVVALYTIGDLPLLRPAGYANWLEDDHVHWAGQPVALVAACPPIHSAATPMPRWRAATSAWPSSSRLQPTTTRCWSRMPAWRCGRAMS
jgi:CO/xanthine dehydrogenase Mo-binding subunit